MAGGDGRWESSQPYSPAPIATGKGLRSSVDCNGVLEGYLKSTLRIPELRLPATYFETRPLLPPPPITAGIDIDLDLGMLLLKDETAVHRVVDGARQVGALLIRGGEMVTTEEVSAVARVLRCVPGLLEEDNEFCWRRPVSLESLTMLSHVLSGDTYGVFREKVEGIAYKLEMIAECIAQILSDSLPVPSHHFPKNISRRDSILCFRKYSFHPTAEDHHHTHALAIYVSEIDHEFLVHSREGSTIMNLPSGSLLVTFGMQLQEWSNGEFKWCYGEPCNTRSKSLDPFIFIAFLCSPFGLDMKPHEMTDIISLFDQLLIFLGIMILYYFGGAFLRSFEEL